MPFCGVKHGLLSCVLPSFTPQKTVICKIGIYETNNKPYSFSSRNCYSSCLK